MFIKPD